MSKEAVGAYLRELREARGMSRTEVAAAARTNESQVVRIEDGDIDTRVSQLMALLSVLGGSPEHVMHLSNNPSAGSAEGVRLAQAYMEGLIVEGSSDDELGAFIADLKRDPFLLSAVKGVWNAFRRRSAQS